MEYTNFFNIELLYVFKTVSDLKSINKSSEILKLSQPAISNKINQLEYIVKEKLFIRTSHGMQLTDFGKRFYPKSKKFLNDFSIFEKSINESSKLEFLSIGALTSIALNILDDFFKKYLYQFKNTTITNSIFDLIESFNNYSSDIVIMDNYFKNKLDGDFFEKEIFEEDYYVVYGINNSKLKEINKLKLSINDISHFNWILYPNYCPIHQILVNTFKKYNLNLPKIVEIDYSTSILNFICNSKSLTVLPASSAIKEVTENISNLNMKKLNININRKVSIFSRNQKNLDLLLKKINLNF